MNRLLIALAGLIITTVDLASEAWRMQPPNNRKETKP
jgi:hypothetical protein